MATWAEMSVGSLKAAKVLRDCKNRRSAVSRAYFAAFSAVTYDLRRRAAVFPRGFEHPPHVQVRRFIKRHMTQFSRSDRNELRDAMARLYEARVDADYRRDVEPDDIIVRNVFADTKYVMSSLGLL